MKKFFIHINNTYYYKFLVYILIFSGLSIILFQIDKGIQSTSFVETLPFTQNFLKDFMIMMIAAIITMVTITFSTIMVVLTLYSGQFSPRTLNDFLQRKVPLNILAYFIGVIVYALISLIISQTNTGIIYSLMTLFALVIFVLSIMLFAYYIHYVAKSVQINVYIDQLVKSAVKDIENYQETIKDDPLIQLERNDTLEDQSFNQAYKAKRTGYLIDINKKKMLNYLKENNVSISVKIPMNEHVYEDDTLFNYQAENDLSLDEQIIKDSFIIGQELGSYSDYREKTMKLVEIAVRALSPGINDPFTALTCIEQLGYVFKKLSDTYDSLYYHDDKGKARIMIKTLNYDDLLYDHFYQIHMYGQKDLTIIASLLKAFSRIAQDSNYDMLDSLWRFAMYILKDIDYKNLHQFDQKEIKIPLKDLAIQCQQMDAFRTIIE